MRIHTPVLHSVLVVLSGLLVSPLAVAAVGATAGRANVTRNGAATYDVQLALPPDRLMPSLGISYSHVRGNGLLGIGFRAQRILDHSTLQPDAGAGRRDLSGDRH
ncbi:MAG: hypothetical protein ACREV5_00740 [Steroidobacter sp.]